MLTLLTALMVAAGVLLAALAAYVGWLRSSRAGVALAVLLTTVAWWGLAYALELRADDLAGMDLWGDLKYLGIALLAPAWLVFVLEYTNRGRFATRRTLVLLAVEPALLLLFLLLPATHDLIRSYPPGATQQDLPVVATGPLFWVHLVYSNVLIVVATALFLVSMVRLSGTYRRMALVLVAAALLPWVVNLLHNFEVGPFARLDLTPFAFILTGAVLVWGLLRERLVELTPLARGAVVEHMVDGVLVVDAFGRLTDANPAAAALLATSRASLVGRRIDDVLEGPTSLGQDGRTLVALPHEAGDRRTFELRRDPLQDVGGRAAGELVILHDVTDRLRVEETLAELLVERSRVAAALQQSLTPGELPPMPGVEAEGRYEPAGDGHEIGGDFFDVFPLEHGTWGVVLGDVSGKGAEAAAVTAMARYTLRALATASHPPSRTLARLNAQLLGATDDERHATLAYAVVRPRGETVEVTVSLAGHHPPLVARRDGSVGPVGELGTVLALLDTGEWYDATVVLGPGDLLCLFTDGLVEARRGQEMFGSERVERLLDRLRGRSVAEVADELVDAPRRFHAPALSHELAVLLLRAGAPA